MKNASIAELPYRLREMGKILNPLPYELRETPRARQKIVKIAVEQSPEPEKDPGDSGPDFEPENITGECEEQPPGGEGREAGLKLRWPPGTIYVPEWRAYFLLLGSGDALMFVPFEHGLYVSRTIRGEDETWTRSAQRNLDRITETNAWG